MRAIGYRPVLVEWVWQNVTRALDDEICACGITEVMQNAHVASTRPVVLCQLSAVPLKPCRETEGLLFFLHVKHVHLAPSQLPYGVR